MNNALIDGFISRQSESTLLPHLTTGLFSVSFK